MTGVDKALLGVQVRKNFPPHGVFMGEVVSYDNPYYMVRYPPDETNESDQEEMEPHEIEEYRIDNVVEEQLT